MKSNNLFKQFGLAQIPLIIALVLMALAIPIATRLSQNNQDIRNRAAHEVTCIARKETLGSSGGCSQATTASVKVKAVMPAGCESGGNRTITYQRYSKNCSGGENCAGVCGDSGTAQTLTVPEGQLEATAEISCSTGCGGNCQVDVDSYGARSWQPACGPTSTPPAPCALAVDCPYAETDLTRIARYCEVGEQRPPCPAGQIWGPLSCHSGPKADGTCGNWIQYKDPNQAACKDPSCTGCACIPIVTPTPRPNVCLFQGYKVLMPGVQTSPPAIIAGQTVTCGPESSASQPYYVGGDKDGPGRFTPGQYNCSVTVPAGYTVGYTYCENRTNCHSGTITQGSSGTFNCPNPLLGNSWGFGDLWWHFTPITSTPTPTPIKPSCSGLTLNGMSQNVTVGVGDRVNLASTISHYGLISSAKVTAIGRRVWDGQDIIRYPYGTRNLSGVFVANAPGIYAIETNSYESSSCRYLCSGGGIFYTNSIGPDRCVVSSTEWQNIGSCSSSGCIRYITVNPTSTVTPTPTPPCQDEKARLSVCPRGLNCILASTVPCNSTCPSTYSLKCLNVSATTQIVCCAVTPTPTPARYPVCGGDCKCTTSTTAPDRSKMGNIKCSYSPAGADCCSSCDRLVRVNDFSVSNTNPLPGETITLKADGVSSKAPVTYRFNYYKKSAGISLASTIGYGCANWDGSKLFPKTKLSNQYWTLIGTIVPTQDMIVSGLSIPFKNDSYTFWSAHIAISDSVGLVSDNNFDSDSNPGSPDHVYDLPGNPVACSKGGQRVGLVTKATRKVDIDFDTRPKLTKGVTYKVWAATDGYEVYAMSCYDQWKPVEIEVYKSNVNMTDAGDLGKASATYYRTWTVPTNAAVGSTYVVMVEVGDQASISNYRLPASTKFDYAAAAVKKTIIIRGPTPTPIRR